MKQVISHLKTRFLSIFRAFRRRRGECICIGTGFTVILVSNIYRRHNIRVLVPGAGLARLPYDVAKLGAVYGVLGMAPLIVP